ncbi:MAG: transcriptional regulator GcvA [Sphingomonadales bacterium]|jgi:LysR family glycine cleavage system transcriptional activator
MKRALLPLNALRVFDAAARHLSFKNAADELAVTPAAVSQQIRALEDYLGVVLFRRQGRGLELTEDAKKSLPALRSGFERFEEAVRVLQAPQRSSTLTISVAPSFASKWLLPRIERFYGSAPNMDVRIQASNQLVNFAEENVDLAIRYGAGDYPDLVVEKLIEEHVFPVCAPSFLEANGGLKDARSLANTTLIHDDSSEEDPSCPTWGMWLRAAGVEVDDIQRGLHFNQSNMAIEAAALGKGVALAKQMIAADDLASGRLVKPFEAVQPVDFAYFLVAPAPQWRAKKVQNFVEWLKAEARQ